MTEEEKILKYFKEFQQSPILFINAMWGLIPQPLKEEHKGKEKILGLKEFKVDWFERFEKGKHITWQQWLILLAVEKSLRGAAPKRVSIKSGHGTGKDTTLSWLILWYLFCFPHSQIPCTAPTSEQIHDILWKEIKLWLDRMPDGWDKKYEWTTGYLRMKESPETWFARAARKENPEALAGVHGDFVFIAVDEASGVPNEIFKPAEGSLTNENVLVMLIGNPRRLIGYFYDSHHGDKFNWQCLTFNSADSPIVEPGFIQRIIDKYGIDSDEYAYMVAGIFPKEDAVDEKGYAPLLVEADIKTTTDSVFVGKVRLGIDPSGAGDNETSWVARDNYKQKVMVKEKSSTGKSIAEKTIILAELLKIDKSQAKKQITIDSFGEGVYAVKELALAGWDINAVNVGEPPVLDDDKKAYMNKKAMAYDRLKKWLRAKGELIDHEDWKPQLLCQRYRRELNGKMKMMSKEDLRKEGFQSPDTVEASMLTFVEAEIVEKKPYKQKKYESSSEFEGQ